MDGGVINANNWLTNILPSSSPSSPKSTNSTNTKPTADNSPSDPASIKLSPKEGTQGGEANAPNNLVQNVKRDKTGGGDGISTLMNSPQKPVNLLPEVPSTTSRKLSDRERRDCEVIGRKSNYFYIYWLI